MMFRRAAFGVMALLLAVGGAQGQATAPAASDLGVVASYVGSQTLAVAHLDAAAVDVDGLEKFARAMLEAKGVKAEQFDVQILAARTFLSLNLAAFQKAGGRHVYAVAEHPDLWPAMQPVAILVPLEAGGDSKAMLDVLKPLAAMGGLVAAELKQNLIFVGNDGALQRLKAMKAEPREDLARALERGKDMPLCVAIALTADARRAIREIMPRLPAEVGGGPMDLLTDELEGISIGVSGKPVVDVLLLMKTGEGATKMKDLATAALTALKQDKDVADGTNGKELLEFLGTLKFELPSQVGLMSGMSPPQFPPLPREVVLELGQKQLELVAKLALPEIQDPRTAEAANINGCLKGCVVWANENNDNLPESLAQLIADGSISPKSLVTKRSTTEPMAVTAEQAKAMDTDWKVLLPAASEHCDFIYLGRGTKNNFDSSMILMYVDPAKVDIKDGMNIGFGDAHVEWVQAGSFKQVFDTNNKARETHHLKPLTLDKRGLPVLEK